MRNNQRRTGQDPEAPPGPSPAMAFASPTEFVELPSCGEFYAEDHPLYKQETVEIWKICWYRMLIPARC